MKTKVKLKDIASYSKGSQINGDKLIENGMYEYLNGGINPSGKWDDYNTPGGTVTISEGGNSCGYVNFMENPFWCGAHCYYLYDTVQNVRYLYYALKSQQDRLMKIRSGACMPNIKKADLGEFDLFFDTDKVEQQGAVDVLQRAERIIADRQYELHVLEDLKKARFVEMFGDPEINPKGWDKAPLKDHAEVLVGYPFPSEGYSEEGVDIVGGYNLMQGYIQWNDSKHWPNETGYEQFLLQENDIVMAMDRPWVNGGFKIARVDANHLPALLIQRTACIRGKGILQEFLHMLLDSQRFAEHCNITGSLVPHISNKDINSFQVILPPIELQNEFASFVAQVDKSKFEVQRSLDEAQKLFDSLMQEYFS